MTVSIIIAVKTWQKNLKECVDECLTLSYPDFEIIVAPDENKDIPYRNIKIIPTGAVSPAEKRDLAAKSAKGDILAFIDDDVYPAKEWLINGVKNFKDPQIVAVGGPALTPDIDDLRQRASGRVYESILVSGPYRYRYLKAKRRYVEDYPSCNFLIRKVIFDELGGFDTRFWPGEDTKLCLNIVYKLRKKIVYDPETLVYHHRRRLFSQHLNQIKSYALHRGYFAKHYPETSLKFSYFLPTIFVALLFIGLLLSSFIPSIRYIYSLFLSFYLGVVLIASISKGLKKTLLVFSGIVLTHIYYGLYFLKGLIVKRLKEERTT